jgi:protein Hikeshi
MQSEFQQVGESQFLINILDADNINHVVVFLTGTAPFQEGMAGGVYFR